MYSVPQSMYMIYVYTYINNVHISVCIYMYVMYSVPLVFFFLFSFFSFVSKTEEEQSTWYMHIHYINNVCTLFLCFAFFLFFLLSKVLVGTCQRRGGPLSLSLSLSFIIVSYPSGKLSALQALRCGFESQLPHLSLSLFPSSVSLIGHIWSPKTII